MFDEITTFWLKIVAQILAFSCTFVLGIVSATLALAKLIRGFEKKQIETDNAVAALNTAVAAVNIKCTEGSAALVVKCNESRDAMKETITLAVREGLAGAEERWGVELAGASLQRAKQAFILESLQKSVEGQQVAINRIHERIDDVALVGGKEKR